MMQDENTQFKEKLIEKKLRKKTGHLKCFEMIDGKMSQRPIGTTFQIYQIEKAITESHDDSIDL